MAHVSSNSELEGLIFTAKTSQDWGRAGKLCVYPRLQHAAYVDEYVLLCMCSRVVCNHGN